MFFSWVNPNKSLLKQRAARSHEINLRSISKKSARNRRASVEIVVIVMLTAGIWYITDIYILLLVDIYIYIYITIGIYYYGILTVYYYSIVLVYIHIYILLL